MLRESLQTVGSSATTAARGAVGILAVARGKLRAIQSSLRKSLQRGWGECMEPLNDR